MIEKIDGTVDVEFGPRPPDDDFSNWIPTVPGEQFGVCVRFDEPPRKEFEHMWLPDISRIS